MAKDISPDELFNEVVKNALDFLKQSVIELETAPKYSVIHFWTAIELFCKARLFHEHWSLVVENPNKANYEALKKGNFVSTGFDTTLERLKGITRTMISEEALSAFAKLRVRRNQLVHFFHSDYAGHPEEELLESIVAEQCRGWFHLHRLLVGLWKKVFSKHAKAIDEIHEELGKSRGFLDAKYDSVKDSITRGIESGAKFRQCRSCGHVSQRLVVDHPPFCRFSCIVCDISLNEVHVLCPDCKQQWVEIDEGEGHCVECEHDVELKELIGIFNPEPDPDPEVFDFRTSCEECDSEYSVIPFDDKEQQFGCVACGRHFSHADLFDCPHCSSPVACYDFESMIFDGCPSCFGVN